MPIINIEIKITVFSPKQTEGHKEHLCLRNNGIYWFLYPYFAKLYDQTGQMIDLYGISNFRNEDLLELRSTIEKAITVTNDQPDQWNQEVAVQIKPPKQILYDSIFKKDVLATLNSLKNITLEAIQNNAVIVFEGM